MVPLFTQLGLDRIEQLSVHDGGLLAGQHLALEWHLSNVKPIVEEVGERSARERNAAHSRARLQRADLADDAALAQVRHKQVQTAELEIPAEDGPHPLSLGFVDGDLAVLGVIAQWRHASDPK